MALRKTVLPDGRVVSTAYIGSALSKLIDKPLDAILDRVHKDYEVMLFVSESKYTDLECERYDTEAEALVAHEAMVQRHSTKN